MLTAKSPCCWLDWLSPTFSFMGEESDASRRVASAPVEELCCLEHAEFPVSLPSGPSEPELEYAPIRVQFMTGAARCFDKRLYTRTLVPRGPRGQ